MPGGADCALCAAGQHLVANYIDCRDIQRVSEVVNHQPNGFSGNCENLPGCKAHNSARHRLFFFFFFVLFCFQVVRHTTVLNKNDFFLSHCWDG